MWYIQPKKFVINIWHIQDSVQYFSLLIIKYINKWKMLITARLFKDNYNKNNQL